MHLAIASLAAFVALVNSASAQDYNQSKPFFLVVHSHDSKYNGTALGACHEGAAIEGLCPGAPLNASSGYSVFQFNTTDNEFVADAALGIPGVLTWVLPSGNLNFSEGMSLAYNPASNVALPLMQPSESNTQVAFDARNRLNIQSYLDDTVSPPAFSNVTALYRWYICESNYSGYLYETLNWVMGKYPPENPSCCKVTIVRQFV